MKLHITGVLGFLMLGSAVGASTDGHTLSDPLEAPATVVPMITDDVQSSNPPPLREVLRQPFDHLDGVIKPYQLSPEERQLMREQLRSQSTHTTQDK